MNRYPFRLGTTSYIIPADIIPNVHYLAGKIQDVELVLFDVDDLAGNLPTRQQIAELAKIASDHDLTYTVHLPLDLRLADDGSERHISLEKARRTIECTQSLDPWAYVLHLDGKFIHRDATPDTLQRWRDQSVQSLDIVGHLAGGVQNLALENLEGYPLDFYEPVFQAIDVCRAVDIGHLWLDHHDPLVYLDRALPRTRVIHIHGIDKRDHQSLAHVPKDNLRAVLDKLIRTDYSGVLTVEVFSEKDFQTSCTALEAVMSELNCCAPIAPDEINVYKGKIDDP